MGTLQHYFMYKPAFDMVSEEMEQVSPGQCRLLVEVGVNRLTYLVYQTTNKQPLLVRQYLFNATELNDATAAVEEVILANEDMKPYSPEALVVYNYADSSFIPADQFQITMTGSVAELVMGNAERGLLLHEKVDEWNLHTIYRVPREIHGLIQKYYSAGRYWHYHSLLLKSVYSKKADIDKPVLRVVFYTDTFIALLHQGESLQLLQTYAYHTPQDAAYLLLHICRQFALEQEEIPMIISGFVDVQSALYQELNRYFLRIEKDDELSASARNLLNDFPSHYFSPLFNLLSCVS